MQGGFQVKKVMYVIFATTLIAALIPMATAQDTKILPPQHLYGAGAQMKMPTIIHPNSNKKPTLPFFCPKATCLMYTGDNDTTSPNNNGLFDFENPGIGITDAQVWVNYDSGPGKTDTITGTAGNYYTNTTAVGTNPTLAAFRTGISAGVVGTPKCATTTGGTVVMAAYGNPNFGLNSFNYWIKKFNKPCITPPYRKKPVYMILVPQYNDGSTIGYLEDDDGAKANSYAKKGFKEIPNNAFFNSTSFGVVMENTSGSGACGGIGCSGFSWALNGKVK